MLDIPALVLVGVALAAACVVPWWWGRAVGAGCPAVTIAVATAALVVDVVLVHRDVVLPPGLMTGLYAALVVAAVAGWRSTATRR